MQLMARHWLIQVGSVRPVRGVRIPRQLRRGRGTGQSWCCPSITPLPISHLTQNEKGETIVEVARGSKGVVGCTPVIKPGDCFAYYSG